MKNLTWQNPEQLFVAQELINKVKSKCCGIKDYLIIVLVLPILFTIDGILEIWLKEVPEYTAIFCRLILILLSTEALTAPLWMSVQATGKIRSYQILMACLIFLNFPIAYVALAIGLPVYSVWCVRILVNIFVIGARCIYMKKKLDFPLFLYFKKVMLPISNVTLLALPIPILLYYTIHGFWQNLIIVGIVTFIVTILDIYYIGMNIQEKEMVSNMILKKISLFRKES